MTDPLADLLDHPPQDPSPTADPRFTAAVMGRVADLPPIGTAASARRLWWLAAAVLALGAFALPSDLTPDAVIDAPVISPAPNPDITSANDTDPDTTLAMLAPFTDPTVLIDGAAGALVLGATALILRAVSGRSADRPLVTP